MSTECNGRISLPLTTSVWFLLIVGCMRNAPDHVNIVDFPPDSCGKRWHEEDLFSDPQLLALAKAVNKEDLREIDRIVAAGADVNLAGKDNVTPLAWALMLERKNAFRHLLQNGANPNHLVGKALPIIEIAAGDGKDFQWLQLCLEHGGDPNVVNQLNGIPHGRQTPIYRAISSGQKKNVDLLIAAGADLEHRDYNGATPLLFGRAVGGHKVAYDLLKAGSDFRAKDNQEWDLICDVIRWRPERSPDDDAWEWRQKVLDFLEKHGADFAAAEQQVAQVDPAALPGWEQEKRDRAARKLKGGE